MVIKNFKASILNRVLKAKTEEINKIGKSLIGNCAEQHAENNYMNQLYENDLGELSLVQQEDQGPMK